jgi:hypothetical protein
MFHEITFDPDIATSSVFFRREAGEVRSLSLSHDDLFSSKPQLQIYKFHPAVLPNVDLRVDSVSAGMAYALRFI